jgi:hypothetical protein
MSSDITSKPVIIRFDGLDADNHEIELSRFAESLQGLARVIAVSANFAATQKLVLHRDAFSVRVYARPSEGRCYELTVLLKWAAEHPLIATTVGGLLVALISYIFKWAASRREEMKHLRGALDNAIRQLGTRDQGMIDRLLDTIDRMAEALRPAARQSVKPLGSTAKSLTIYQPDESQKAIIDEADKDAILSTGDSELTSENSYNVEITELDMETSSAKVRIEGDNERRINAKITDPALQIRNNKYAEALASMAIVEVRAKCVVKDGKIDRMYISDIV